MQQIMVRGLLQQSSLMDKNSDQPLGQLLSSEEKRRLAIDVLAYLVENPDAKDTLVGIASWWLLRQRVENQVRSVRDVLDVLVQNGLLTEVVGHPDSFYQINPEHKNVINQILEIEKRNG